MRTPLLSAAIFAAVVATTSPTGLRGQDVDGGDEAVTYVNPRDSTRLDASLVLPGGPGPHRGVVLLSVAGTDPLVDALVGRGFAVLTPVRRGFVSVEPLLRASFSDLAGDVEAALAYLASRQDVSSGAVAVVAQADDTPPAILAAARIPVPLVLLAPPAFGGAEEFRRSQRWLAERDGATAEELEALDGYVRSIAGISLEESAPYVREYRLQRLRATSAVALPRNAAFPPDHRQAHFFASPLWHDRLAFDPESALSRLHAPTLVLIGEDDANTPLDTWVTAVGRGLDAAPADDVAVCVVAGRTRHAFPPETVRGVMEWLSERVGPTGRASGPPEACLEASRPG